MSEFEKLKMIDSDLIDDFAGKLSQLASKATFFGETIEEPRLVKNFFNNLPSNIYIHIVASLEQVLDLKTTCYEDIVGRLKAYEEQILDDDKQQDTQGKLLYTSSDQTNFSNFRGRDRGRGGRGNRGRGRGRNNAQDRENYQADKNRTKEKKDRLNVVCYRYDKAGHFASVCPERKQKIQEANKIET